MDTNPLRLCFLRYKSMLGLDRVGWFCYTYQR